MVGRSTSKERVNFPSLVFSEYCLKIHAKWKKCTFMSVESKNIAKSFLHQKFRKIMWNFAIWNRIFAAHFLKNKSNDFLQNLSSYATWCGLSFEKVYRNFVLSKFCNIKIIKKVGVFAWFFTFRDFSQVWQLKFPSNFLWLISRSITVIYVILREIVGFVLENDTGIYEWFLKQNFRIGKRKIAPSCCPNFVIFRTCSFGPWEHPM